MNFSEALIELKKGNAVKRKGYPWFLLVQKPSEYCLMTQPYVYCTYPDFCLPDYQLRTPWQPSSLELFAEDWEILEDYLF